MNCLLEKQRRVVVRTHSKLKVERRIGPYQPFCQLRTDIYNNITSRYYYNKIQQKVTMISLT